MAYGEFLSHEDKGSDLALSIAQWIVKAHWGDIQIASMYDRLTRVSVEPLLQAD